MGISSGLGNALVPTSYGFRNEIINGNFMINQRGYTSGSNLASGSYGFDRWKSAFTNTSLTFTSAPQGQLVTISASGVIRQIVERANIVAGSYVLSWTGTATGRVYNSGASAPSYAVSPVSVYLDGTADVIVEFTPASGTATLGNVQLELGSRATPFEQRLNAIELALCQRYYYRVSLNATNRAFCLGWADSSTVFVGTVPFPQIMRTRPTALETTGTASDYAGIGPGVSMAATSVTYDGTSGDFQGTIVVTGSGGLTTGRGGQIRSNTNNTSYFAWSAEL